MHLRPLDLKRRGKHIILHRELLLNDHDGGNLFVARQLGVHEGKLTLQALPHGILRPRLPDLTQGNEQDGLRHAEAEQTHLLNVVVTDEFVFDFGRDNEFSLRRLERILHAAGEVEVAIGVDFALVSGVEPAVGVEGLRRLFGAFVVAQHGVRGAGEHLLRLRINAVLRTGLRAADGAGLVLFGGDHVARRAVLRHAVGFRDRDAEAAEPLLGFRRDRRGTGHVAAALVQPEAGADLALHQRGDQGYFQQFVQLVGGHFAEHAKAQLRPDARYGEEESRPGILQIGREAGDALSEENLPTVGEAHRLDHPALRYVVQRQKAEEAVAAFIVHFQRVLVPKVAHQLDQCFIAQHHALRRSGGAGGEDDRPEAVPVGDRAVFDGLELGQDVAPGLPAHDVGIALVVRETDHGHILGHAFAHIVPDFHFTGNEQVYVAQPQYFGDLVSGQGSEEGNAYVARHHDGEVRDDPLPAVFADQADVAARLQLKAAQVSGYPAGHLPGFAPGVGLPFFAKRLVQKRQFGVLLFAVVKSFEGGFVVHDLYLVGLR